MNPGPGLGRAAVAGAPGGTGDDTMAIATVDPATGEIVKTYDEMSEDDVERCLAAAAAAHASYRDQLRREGRVDAQPGHACHRLQVFADRADVHVTHVPASPACR